MRYECLDVSVSKKVVAVSVQPKNLVCISKWEELLQFERVTFNLVSPDREQEMRQRAKDYCAYLNAMEEAKEEAVKSITIATAVAKRMSSP